MVLNLYCLYDRLQGDFGDPVSRKNDETACRTHLSELKKSPYPSDFSLYRIGTMDHETGEIQSNLVELMRGKEQLVDILSEDQVARYSGNPMQGMHRMHKDPPPKEVRDDE